MNLDNQMSFGSTFRIQFPKNKGMARKNKDALKAFAKRLGGEAGNNSARFSVPASEDNSLLRKLQQWGARTFQKFDSMFAEEHGLADRFDVNSLKGQSLQNFFEEVDTKRLTPAQNHPGINKARERAKRLT